MGCFGQKLPRGPASGRWPGCSRLVTLEMRAIHRVASPHPGPWGTMRSGATTDGRWRTPPLSGGREQHHGKRRHGRAATWGSGTRGRRVAGAPAGPSGSLADRPAGRRRSGHLISCLRGSVRGHRGTARQRGQRGSRAQRGGEPRGAAPPGGGPASQPGPARSVLALVLRPLHRASRSLADQWPAGLGLYPAPADQLGGADAGHRGNRRGDRRRARCRGRAAQGRLVRPRHLGRRAGGDLTA